MKLYLIHTGYYDKNVEEGFFEQHTNIFIVAKNAYAAREKVKKLPEYLEKKMHIDGMKEIENISGYDINLKKSSKKEKVNNYNHYQVRFLSKNKKKD
tara:strand:+ start:32 stop:322 length:291 start_codon:yes stop_codon:yes gene_type:complete